jgi:hypothetical protein
MRYFHFGVFMELNTTTSHAISEAKVTSHYWGYRELSANEVLAGNGAGDFSGDGFDSGSNGGSANGNAIGNQAAAATATQECRANNNLLTVNIIASITQGTMGAGMAAYGGWCYDGNN